MGPILGNWPWSKVDGPNRKRRGAAPGPISISGDLDPCKKKVFLETPLNVGLQPASR